MGRQPVGRLRRESQTTNRDVMEETPTSPKQIEQRKLFAWLWRKYLKKHVWVLVLVVILMAIEGAMMGGLAYMLQPLFDRVFVGGSLEQLYWVGAIVFALFLARALLSIGHRVLMTTISRKSVADLQNDLLQHLLNLDMVFFTKTAPGYLIERVQGDVQAVNQIWGALVRGAARDLVGLISLVVVMITIDWVWTLIAILGTPVLLFPSLVAQRYTRKQAAKARDVAANMASRLDEAFHGIGSIKLNGLENYYAGRYKTLTKHQIRVEVKTLFGTAVIPSLVDVMSGIGFAGVIIYGGYEIIQGDKTVGQFMAFFSALGLSFEPLRRLGGITGLVNAAAVSIQRMQDILAETPKIVAPKKVQPLNANGDIVFENVSLAFGDMQVLSDLSFTSKAGSTTAFVGASGAGKTTVFNALSRMFEYQGGQITIGGTSNRDVDPYALREQISVVSQDAVLFDETLRENILLGATHVSEAKLNAVLDAARVSEFLQQLPLGLDTPVGARGSNLSGGQRQRVAIARALLRDTPILLLDEATSALDTRSETLVQQALDEISTNRTTLVIAHRLSTIQNADQIIVMDRGRVVETGTHDALLAQNGYYADLCRLQFSDLEEA